LLKIENLLFFLMDLVLQIFLMNCPFSFLDLELAYFFFSSRVESNLDFYSYFM
jgi:hypothetical protein